MLHEVRDLMYDNTFIITYIVLLGTAIKMNQYARINSLLCFNWGGEREVTPQFSMSTFDPFCYKNTLHWRIHLVRETLNGIGQDWSKEMYML